MEFSDMHITAAEFFDILHKAWEKSEFFDGWDKRWHPEDIAYNVEAVFDGVTQGLVAYCNIVGDRVRRKAPATVDPQDVANRVNELLNAEREQRIEDIANAGRVQVFGGTLPKDYDHKRTSAVPAYTGNAFGDNV